MSILDIKKKDNRYKYNKTVIIFIFLSIFAFIVNKVYALFGHGVSSDSMTWMFLYPLIGGGLVYLILGLLLPAINRFAGFGLFYNLYNSGIAALTVGSLLKGIMEIAGTSSSYLKLYFLTGYFMLGAGAVTLLLLAMNYRKLNAGNVIAE